MLLIFVVETTESNKSDEMYIKKYIRTMFPQLIDSPGSVVKWVYMNGKGNYKKNSTLHKIEDYSKRYLRFYENVNDIHVIYCVDLDDTCQALDADNNKRLNREIKAFCDERSYKFVWFNRTIEEVFLGKKILRQKDKSKEAQKYIRKEILNIEYGSEAYNANDYMEGQTRRTNLGTILAKL
ncbi:MAG: hypothetical protein K6F82_02880 [Sphaerochaetaceae bacterium]|nr:hypothetical protein [Sphaerochaetaceae bacterium]